LQRSTITRAVSEPHDQLPACAWRIPTLPSFPAEPVKADYLSALRKAGLIK
jgi:hypothetical protein